MKKINLIVFLLIVSGFTVMTGCKKKKKDPEPEKTFVKPNDQQGSAEADEAIANANDLINNKIGDGANQRRSAYNLPCGVVSVDSSTTSGGNKVYKMNYGNQTPCGYKYKSGEVSFVLTNGTAFNQAGAKYNLTFTDYVVEVQATGQYVKLNGTITVTNVNGGYIWEAITIPSTITHRIRGSFDVTYSDNTTRTRKYFQLRTWNSSGTWATLSLTIAGDTTINSNTVSELGKTYDGNYDYQTQILTSLVWSNCGTTFAGPYVLKTGHAKLDVTIPLITPTYIDIEAGYNWDYTNPLSTPTLVNSCSSNAYKITTVIGSASSTQYQLY